MALSTSGGEEEVMSTINITPFTDVLLVLLIIFIILASVTKEPTLPTAYNKETVSPSDIVVIIDAKNLIQIGSNTVSIFGAQAAFRELQDATGGHLNDVIIKANPKAQFGTILQVMNAAKSVGLINFGLANHVQGTPQGVAQ